MANITERQTKSGVAYRIRVSAGYDDNYTQIMRSMTYKPKPGMSQRQIKAEVNRQAVLFEEKVRQEQAEKKKRIEMGLDDDLSLSAKRVRFEPLAEEWLNLMETTHEMKPATIIRIKTMRERTYKAIGNVYVDVLNYRHIQKFITSLAQKGVNKHTGGGLSQKTQKHYVTFISDVLNYARTCGLVTDNPCTRVKTVKTDKKEKEIYSLDELKTLLMRINEKADLQHRVMFNLLAYCGMRRGELMGLEFKDIDFKNNTLEIVRTSNYQNGETGIYTSTPKTKSSVRELYLQPHLTELIRQWYDEQQENAEKCGDLWAYSDRLFINWRGEPMRPYYPYKWLKDFCEKENLPFKGLHSFRHTVATESIVNGVDVSTVSAILGHSSVSTTLNVYTHAVKKAKAKAANVMAGLIDESA